MTNFNLITTEIERLFASVAWTTHNINTYPANYQGNIQGDEWVRTNVLIGNSKLVFAAPINESGLVVCNIFVPAGAGVRRAMTIADLCSDLLSLKTISGIQTTNSIQLTNGYITVVGVDPIDPGLFRVDYTVHFNNYNE